MKTVDYYFCLNSPWSLFASKQLINQLPDLNVQLNLKPLNIGELFTAINFPPVPERPQYMQDYRLLELTRWSKRLGIPIQLHPTYFPSNEVGALALVLAAEQHDGSGLTVAAELSHDLWNQNANIADADYLSQQATSRGLSELLDTEQCSEIMSANTKELLARGGFGVPTFIVDDELIWGQDRLDFLIEAVS